MHQTTPKADNFAAIRITRRIEEAKAADPDTKPTEIQDMMVGEIRKHYRALLEKRGVSMPLSSAVIEEVTLPTPALASAKVDTETGEILADEESAVNLLAAPDEPETAELVATETEELDPALSFMADISKMLDDKTN